VASFTDVFRVEFDDEPRKDPPAVSSRPEWIAPPEDELGVCVPIGRVVGRSERGVIALSHVTAFSTGVVFALVAQLRGLRRSEASRVFHEQHMGMMDGEELPDAFLRLGLELPDGRRVSNLAGRRAFALRSRDEAPEEPVLAPHGGGGGQAGEGEVSMRPGYWLWPLPEPGTLDLVCEWPIAGIALSKLEIDATQLRGAAERVERLWRT
jgi:hypothetical protein